MEGGLIKTLPLPALLPPPLPPIPAVSVAVDGNDVVDDDGVDDGLYPEAEVLLEVLVLDG